MQIPQKVGKYQIVERIGRGGMGYVYKAVDPILKRDVAIKCMLKDLSDDQDLRSRFMREAQSAGGLRHPNVVTIYDLGEDEQRCPYIAMEFLTGTDLEHIIKNKIELQLLKKLDIIIQTCQGLEYAHSKGIIHRDIKPANIRLLDNGEVKIMDFGIAKIAASQFTRAGMVMGTPHYMSPEQIRGEKVDGRADIFSLGVVLYELLVFRKPYSGDNPTAVLFKIIHSDPDPLVDADFVPPEGLEQIVFRALAKKTQDRYQTCEDFTSDLMNVFNQLRDQMPSKAEPTAPSMPYAAISVSRTPTPSFRKVTPVAKPAAPTTPLPGKEAAAQTQKSAPLSTATKPLAPATITPATQPYVAKQTLTPKQATPARPDLPPISPTPVPSPIRKWLLVGSSGVLGVALIGFLLFGVIRKITVTSKPHPVVLTEKPAVIQHLPKENAVATPTPSSNSEQPPVNQVPPPPAPGWVSLNVQPWAEIKEIKDEKGNVVTPPLAMTPCKMQLGAGKYEITLVHSQFKSMVIQAEVRSNETTVINRKMEGFDYAKAIDSLGL